MPLRRDPLFALQDVEKSAEAVAEYTAGLDEAAFLADRMRQDAVGYRLLVVGEALSRLGRDSPELALRIPEREQAIGLRNYLAHEYDRIDHVTVWDTAVHDLPELRRTVESLISELDSASAPTSAASDRGEMIAGGRHSARPESPGRRCPHAETTPYRLPPQAEEGKDAKAGSPARAGRSAVQPGRPGMRPNSMPSSVSDFASSGVVSP